MYEITVIKTFSAAHRLRNYKGRCENLHGHNWKVEVTLTGNNLGQGGMLFDFTELKKILEKILERLDHGYLNEMDYFKKVNPTSENIAKYIYDKTKLRIVDCGLRINKVTVWESDNSYASYIENKSTRAHGTS